MQKRTALVTAAGGGALLSSAQRDGELPPRSMTREMLVDVRADVVDTESRTIELSFSSETAVARWWGNEILDHGKRAIRLGRLNGGGAVLMDHNVRDQVGVVQKAWLDGKVCRAVVRFGQSARAQEIFQDVQDGIRKLVSVGYNIFEMVLEKSGANDGETYRITDWEPFEISIVAVPADTNVGVGRDGKPPEFDPRSLIASHENEPETEETNDMRVTRNAPDGAPNAVAAVESRGAAPAQIAAPASVDHQQAIREERDRAANIRALGARLGAGELADAAIADGRSLGDFIAAVNARQPETQAIRTAEGPEIGLSEAETQRFSMVRLFNAMANPTDVTAQRAAGFEMECSAAAMQRGGGQRQQGAMRIPHDVLISSMSRGVTQAQRDLMTNPAANGGNLVATELVADSFIAMLRNATVLDQVGARFLSNLNGNLAIPRQSGGATAYWVAEGAASTESQMAVDQVTLSPKTVTAMTDVTRQLLLQSSADVENLVRVDLATAIGLALDVAGLNGSGAGNQPRGVLNTVGIGAEAGGANGAAPNWDNIVNLESGVANANAAMGSMAYVTNTKARGKLKRTQRFAGTNGDPIWERDGTMNGYPAAVTNQMPSNLVKGASGAVCSGIVFGNWQDLLIGLWGGLDVLVNPYILSGTGTVRIEVYQSADIAVRHPESFSAMLDALTA